MLYNIDWKIFTDYSKGRNAIITFRVIWCKKSGNGLLDPENEGYSIVPKVGKLVPDGVVQHHSFFFLSLSASQPTVGLYSQPF